MTGPATHTDGHCPDYAQMRPAVGRLAWFTLFIGLLCQSGIASATEGFLGESLPLKIVVTTPVELLKAAPKSSVYISGSQALTVGAGRRTRSQPCGLLLVSARCNADPAASKQPCHARSVIWSACMNQPSVHMPCSLAPHRGFCPHDTAPMRT